MQFKQLWSARAGRERRAAACLTRLAGLVSGLPSTGSTVMSSLPARRLLRLHARSIEAVQTREREGVAGRVGEEMRSWREEVVVASPAPSQLTLLSSSLTCTKHCFSGSVVLVNRIEA